MTAVEATVAVIDALERLDVAYMIVGSLASNFHGIPRATRDADFVIDIGSASLSALATALPKGLTLQPQGAFETVTGTMRYLVTLGGSPFVCELFARSDEPHDLERFARRQRARVLGRDAYVASAEDMIITKLTWATRGKRTKDFDDIRNILAVRGDELDSTYLRTWTTAHGTLTELERIRASLPKL